MKKAISIILNVLSIISAVITLIFVAFCAYDWVRIANSDFAYSIDFWLVIDFYALCMLSFSGAGLVFAIPNCFIAQSENVKKCGKILTAAFALVVIISVVLYILPLQA